MDFKLSRKDVEWLATQHPGLNTKRDKKFIEGDIFVERSYNGVLLSGTFSIKIELKHRPNTILPKVYIVSKKLKNIAIKLNINMLDIHVNHDQSICMVISEKEHECFKEGFTIEDFFENCIEPYFYWVMHYDKFEAKPWGEYAHREFGFFEMHAEEELSYEKLVSKFDLYKLHKFLATEVNGKCFCGSTKPMQECHYGVYKGLQKIQAERNLRELRAGKKQVINIPIISPLVYNAIS